MGEQEHKLSQYADDTSLILDGSEISLRTTLNLLDQFSKFSGLKPNIEKTKATWVGSMNNSPIRLCQDVNLDWLTEKFSMLGIDFYTDLEKMVINYENKITDMENLIKICSRRKLTVLGKIQKSLTFSFGYLNQVMPQ